jgi:hypothetical protein
LLAIGVDAVERPLVMDMTFLRPVDFVHDERAVAYVGSADDVAQSAPPTAVIPMTCPATLRRTAGSAPGMLWCPPRTPIAPRGWFA